MLDELWQATRLYGQGQQHKATGRRVKFFLRALAQWPCSSRWFRFLQEQPELAAALPQQPQWLHKLQRPYLCAGYRAQHKLGLLCQHFTVFLGHLPAALRSRLLAGEAVAIARAQGKSGNAYVLRLATTRIMDKEGELMLTLEAEDSPDRLATLAFSFLLAPSGQAGIQIGCLQGPKLAGGREQFKRITKDLHGLMPKVLLVKALCDIGCRIGAETVLAVSNQAHVHNSAWHHYTAIQADYDGFWRDFGGVRLNRELFRFTAHRPRRDLSEVASHKRAQYARRQAVEDSIQAQINACLAYGHQTETPAAEAASPRLQWHGKPFALPGGNGRVSGTPLVVARTGA